MIWLIVDSVAKSSKQLVEVICLIHISY